MNPLIIVECKSDNATIKPDDYGQGDNYARLANARFFVTHNNRETKFWRVVHDRMPKNLEEISNVLEQTRSELDKETEWSYHYKTGGKSSRSLPKLESGSITWIR